MICQLEVLRNCFPASVRRILEELPESLDETYERILREIKKPNRDLAHRVLQCLAVAIRPLRVAELAEVLALDFDDVEGVPRLKEDWRWLGGSKFEPCKSAKKQKCPKATVKCIRKGAASGQTSRAISSAKIDTPPVTLTSRAPTTQSSEALNEQEHTLLAACSSLIAIVKVGDVNSDAGLDIEAAGVEDGYSRVVQFSHFSVKEFLTSSRLSTASGEVSAYGIDLENAHAILAQACLGVLLHTHGKMDSDGNAPNDHPLAQYAAEHWTTHAQFGKVSSRLQKGIESLFDIAKPYFKAWLSLYDIDTRPTYPSPFYCFTPDSKLPAAPLYYAALCGFNDLVEHLISKYPQHVNANGGYYMRPLIAALAGEHFRTADLLHYNDADLHVQGKYGSFPLHSAANFERFHVVQKLIEYDADVDAEDVDGWTPLSWASRGHHFKDGSVLRLLLESGAGVNSRAVDDDGCTPLHRASINGALEVVRLLLEHGADVEVLNKAGETALQVVGKAEFRIVGEGQCDEIRRLLVQFSTTRCLATGTAPCLALLTSLLLLPISYYSILHLKTVLPST